MPSSSSPAAESARRHQYRRHPWLEEGGSRGAPRETPRRAPRPPDRALRRSPPLGPDRSPGHRRQRQGRHDPHVMSGLNPQGSPSPPSRSRRRREARTTISGASTGRARARQDRHLQPLALRGVLVVRVHDIVPKSEWSRALRPDQRLRAHALGERRPHPQVLPPDLQAGTGQAPRRPLEDPSKNWKFSAEDTKERKYWDDYIAAYEDALRKCSTPSTRLVSHPVRPQMVPQPRRRPNTARRTTRHGTPIPEALRVSGSSREAAPSPQSLALSP